MDERLLALEKACDRDPESPEKLRALIAYCRRAGWTFRGRDIDAWVEALTCLIDNGLSYHPGRADRPGSELRAMIPRFLPGLAAVAGDARRPVRERHRALEFMLLVDERCQPIARELIPLCQDPNGGARRAAVRILGRCGRGIPGVFEALKDTPVEGSWTTELAVATALVQVAETLEQASIALPRLIENNPLFRPTAPVFKRWARRFPAELKALVLELLAGLKFPNYAMTTDPRPGPFLVELLFHTGLLEPADLSRMIEEALTETRTHRLNYLLGLCAIASASDERLSDLIARAKNRLRDDG